MHTSKKSVVFIVIVAVLAGWLFNLVAGRYLAAVVSTWPVLNRLGILDPQAPIVINNREVVRVEGSGDAQSVVNNVKSKISLVVYKEGSSVNVTGAALNLASDGVFVSASSAFGKTSGEYYIVLNDGKSALITNLVKDPASRLMFFKVNLNGVPTASITNSKDLAVGERVVFVSNSLENFLAKAAVSSVSFSQNDIAGQTILADMPARSFGAQVFSELLPGETVVNNSGDVVGIWDGAKIVSSDVLRQAMSLYFSGGQKITRPSFGFSYSLVSGAQNSLTGQTQGFLVKEVSLASPAQTAGLKLGDIITKVDGQDVNEGSLLEESLQKYKPADSLNLTVARGSQILVLKLVVAELK